jgi:exopolyphosphatase/guanosine-5'-triphosphate,3'-diphosphate pyrophosphatase
MQGLFALPPTPPEMVAAVDLGSNSFHMIVARISGGQVHLLDRLREPVRLGGGLDEHKNLSLAARQRALACLERFGERARDMPPGSVRAVGTNTLRVAHNAREFLKEAERALGHPIEIIAGREEARLVYLGVAHSTVGSADRCLVIDIGGGSTEFIIGERLEPLLRESLHMGCVNMSQRFFGDGQIKPRAMRDAEIAARLELQPIAHEFRHAGWKHAIGSSGTNRAIEKILRGEGWSEQGICRAGLYKLREALLHAGHVGKLNFKTFNQERAPVLAGGVAVLLGAFEELGLEQMTVSEGALREGLVYDLLGRIFHEDARDQSIRYFQQRYNVDLAQARRVETTALDCLRQTQAAWGGEEHGQLLAWAALLHEIGLLIAHNQYHKHGAYILTHSDLDGFSRQEQNLLALLTRGHRRKFPLAEFDPLPEAERRIMIRLCLLLRLAALLHRGRSDAALPPFSLQASGNSLRVGFPENWLSQHPLTQADLENERAYLLDAGIRLEYF